MNASLPETLLMAVVAGTVAGTLVYIISALLERRHRPEIERPKQSRIYWVVAGTPSESEAMRQELLVPRHFWRNVGWEGENLRGHNLHPGDVIFVGTWDERDDLDEVTTVVNLATRLP